MGSMAAMLAKHAARSYETTTAAFGFGLHFFFFGLFEPHLVARALRTAQQHIKMAKKPKDHFIIDFADTAHAADLISVLRL